MPCAVLNMLHPMVGVDIHLELTPPGAPPIPIPVPIPHAVAAVLGHVPGSLINTVKRSDTSQGKNAVYVNFVKMPMILQGSDLGWMIPHIPMAPCTPLPNLPIVILTSGSVSEFFAFSVKAHGKAIANAQPAVWLTANMNCAFPCAMPLNVVLAPSLVVTGFRIGDFFAGLAGMAMDAALSLVLNLIFVGKTGAGGLVGLLEGRLGASMAGRATEWVLSNLVPPFLGSIAGLGSPVGYSSEDRTLIGHYWGSLKENVQNSVASHTREATRAISDFFTE